MKGKVVNFCMALLNLLLGVTIVIFVLKIPREITELTVQEYQIVNILKIMIYITFGVTTVLNVIQYFLNGRNGIRKTAYLLATFSISFLFIQELPIVTFSILSFLMIVIGTLREHWIETNSIFAISIIGIICIICIIICGGCLVYSNLGSYILDKENENELAYKTDYFKYVTELNETDTIYLNVKRDDLYGYINVKGETVIDFQFEYASPFVPIRVNNKNYHIALVCKDGSTWVILKNLRKVMTYRSESMPDDYEAKIEELKNIYYNILEQEPGTLTYEISKASNSIMKIPVNEREEVSNVYTYTYNDKYDIVITQSSFGFGDTYTSVDKENPNLKYALESENLCYDENYLYIYRSGTIPCYDTSSKKQGWFSITGNKRVLSGKAQILDIFGDNILIKNHNDDTIYFIDNDSNKVSDIYKEIFIVSDNRFIVKQKNNKYAIINEKFEKVIDKEFDFVDTTILNSGLVITGNSSNAISFNDYDYAENMQLSIINLDGQTVFENANQIYDKYYYISNDENITYAERYSDFLNKLKVMKCEFIGDKFYEE